MKCTFIAAALTAASIARWGTPTLSAATPTPHDVPTVTAAEMAAAHNSDAAMDGESVKARDSVAERAPYPERLLRDFPIIYIDTTYVTPRYHLVVRAVWMSRRKPNCRVTISDTLPRPAAGEMVRFIPDAD